jgi:hypothetical protein
MCSNVYFAATAVVAVSREKIQEILYLGRVKNIAMYFFF